MHAAQWQGGLSGPSPPPSRGMSRLFPASSQIIPAGNYDLAIICGYGTLPVEIANAALANGRSPFMIGIEGEAESVIETFPNQTLAWGQIGHLFKLLRQLGIKEAIFAGGVRRRPEFLKMKLDWGAIRALPKALIFMMGGDNTVLSGTIKIFEGRGVKVAGIKEIAPQLIAGEGTIVGKKPSKRDLAGMKLAYNACKALGRFDIGQASIAEAARVVAVEGAEGTDAMLERIVDLRRIGRMPAEGKNGVLVKTLKPGQDLRADLPAIGPKTVEGVSRAGLKGIAVEAGHAIILERDATLEAARNAQIYIYGISEKDGFGDG